MTRRILLADADAFYVSVARELLGRLRGARRVPARLLGVALSQLVREDAPAQLSLLPPAPGEAVESERDRRVSAVVDELRRWLGEDAVVRGRAPRRGRR